MKNQLIKILPVILIFNFCSCEEDFNLKSDYRPRYALYCIIRADSTTHVATITKSYMFDGFDVNNYQQDPFISGADIRLWHKDTVYYFRDTSFERTDTSRFKDLQKAYILRNYHPDEDDFLEIRAVLENGKKLEASTRVPVKVSWDTTSTDSLPGQFTDEFIIKWVKRTNVGWFQVRLLLRYKKDGPGSPTISSEIPVRYDNNLPIYPLPTKNSGIAYKWSAFDRLIKEIGQDQPNKEKILIYGVLVELLIFDESLSKYLSNSNGYMDDYTVKLDQNDYSNVSGGLGIFGSFITQKGGILIEKSYIESLGYGVPN